MLFQSSEPTILWIFISIVFMLVSFISGRSWAYLVLLSGSFALAGVILGLVQLAVLTLLALAIYSYAQIVSPTGPHITVTRRFILSLFGVFLICTAWVFLKSEVLGVARLVRIIGLQPTSTTPFQILGISYFCFKAIHFLMDTSSGRIHQRDLPSFLLYMIFPPTLAVGPMFRYQGFVRQIEGITWKIRSTLLWAGIFRISLGCVKSLLLAPIVQPWATDLNGLLPRLGLGLGFPVHLLSYSAFIYLDFSGACDIAIGSGFLIGFRVPENFDRPYLARNLRDFWRRWHITLSSLLRHYLFVPLVKSLSLKMPRLPRWVVSCTGYLVTFVVCGLWHGLAWNYVIWGLWHGCGLAALAIIDRIKPSTTQRKTMPVFFSAVITFLFVTLGWFPFQHSLSDLRSFTAFLKERTSNPSVPAVTEFSYQFMEVASGGARLNLKFHPTKSQDAVSLAMRPAGTYRWFYLRQAIPALQDKSYTIDFSSNKVNSCGLILEKEICEEIAALSINSSHPTLFYGKSSDGTQGITAGKYEVAFDGYLDGKRVGHSSFSVSIPSTSDFHEMKDQLADLISKATFDSFGCLLNVPGLNEFVENHREISLSLGLGGDPTRDPEFLWTSKSGSRFDGLKFCESDTLLRGIPSGTYFVRLIANQDSARLFGVAKSIVIQNDSPVDWGQWSRQINVTAHRFPGYGIGLSIAFPRLGDLAIVEALVLQPHKNPTVISVPGSTGYIDIHGDIPFKGENLNLLPGLYPITLKVVGKIDGRVLNQQEPTIIEVPDFVTENITFSAVPRDFSGVHWRKAP